MNWMTEQIREIFQYKLFNKKYIVISTEGALRLPMTYDNHPSHPKKLYENDLSIGDVS